MKTFVSALAAVVLFLGILGFSALKVLTQEAKKGVNDLLPTEFRQKVSLQQIDDHRAELAKVAATIDRGMLPRYADFLPGVTYSGLRDANFEPFRNLVADLKEASEKVSKDLCCLTNSGTRNWAAKQKKLQAMHAAAEEELKLMETLAARVQELNELEDAVNSAVSSLRTSETPKLSGGESLESIKDFIVSCRSRANEEDYKNEFRSRLNGGISHAEMAEMKSLLETLEVASK
jgi:hypothetical protein